MKLTAEMLRTRAATHSLFMAPTVREAVTRLGLVQADPIQAPARAQDLILRQRVEGYHAGDLERGYATSGLEEDVLHVYGYMPRAIVPLLLPRPGEWHFEREHPELAGRILAYITEHGPTSHRALEQHFGSARTRGEWGNQAKVTTRMLNMLHYRGQLRVAHRVGNDRFFVIAEHPVTSLSAEERLRQLVRLFANLYAPISLLMARIFISHLRYAAPTLEGRRTLLRRMVDLGELVLGEVDGRQYFWPAHTTFATRTDGEVRLLAPFDPIVHDRDRFEHLWGWAYRFEAYTPLAKRKWGYYALPMLWHNAIVGWANVAVREGQLHVETGFINGQPAARGFKRALAQELERMEAFLL